MSDPIAETRDYLATPKTLANFRAWLNLQALNDEDYTPAQRNIFRAWSAPGVVEGIDTFAGTGNSDGRIQLAEFNAAIKVGGFTVARAGTLVLPPPKAKGAAAPLPAPGYTQALNAGFLNEVFGADVATIGLAQAQTRAADGTLSALARHTLRGLIRNWDTIKNNGNDLTRATLETNIRETFGIRPAVPLTLSNLENYIQFKTAERLYNNAYTRVVAPVGVGAQIESPIVPSGAFPTTAAGRNAFIRNNSTGGVLRLTIIRKNNTTCTFFIPPQITTVDSAAYPAAIEASVQTHPTGCELDSRPVPDHASLMRLLIIHGGNFPIPTGVGHNGFRRSEAHGVYPATSRRRFIPLTDTVLLSQLNRTFFAPGSPLSFVTAGGLPRIPANFLLGGSNAGIQFRPITTAALSNDLHPTNGFSTGQTALDTVLGSIRNP